MSKTLPQNDSKENIKDDREVYRDKYIFSDQRQKTPDDLRLIK